MSSARGRKKNFEFEDAESANKVDLKDSLGLDKIFDELSESVAKKSDKKTEQAVENKSSSANLPVDITKIPRHALAFERELPIEIIEELQLNKILKIENKNEKIFKEVINDDIEFILEKHSVSKTKTTIQKTLENLERKTNKSSTLKRKLNIFSPSNFKKLFLLLVNASLYYPAIKAVIIGAMSQPSLLAVTQVLGGTILFFYNFVWSISIIRQRFPAWVLSNPKSWDWEYDEIAKFKPDLSPRLKRRLADIIKTLPTEPDFFNEFLIFYRKKNDSYNLSTIKIVGQINLNKNTEKLHYDLLTWDMDVDREIF